MSDLHSVLLTAGAERDLADLFDYIAEADSAAAADRVLDGLLACIETLAVHPERGNIPAELADLGIREYRQLHFKRYRIIYRILGQQIHVYLVVDGRRGMQSMLARRLLG
jgi:toxin ParE1/3/4